MTVGQDPVQAELTVHELRPVASVLKPLSLDERRAAVEKAVRVSGERA